MIEFDYDRDLKIQKVNSQNNKLYLEAILYFEQYFTVREKKSIKEDDIWQQNLLQIFQAP